VGVVDLEMRPQEGKEGVRGDGGERVLGGGGAGDRWGGGGNAWTWVTVMCTKSFFFFLFFFAHTLTFWFLCG
jgi:hypothetical protein